MRILVLANNDIGLYNFRKELLGRLLADGHSVFISLPYGAKVDALMDAGCVFIDTPIDRRGINPITDAKLLKNYFSMFREIQPDKVITYTIKPNIYGGLVSRIKKVPLYANVTGLGTAFQGNFILKTLVTMLYKAAFKRVKVVFFENEENRDVIVRRKIVKKEATHCLHGAGVNLDTYAFTAYPSEGTTRFLFVGRVMREKGIGELFEVATRLKAEGLDVAVDIVGPFEEDYSAQVEKLQADGVITYHGYQADVRPFIEKTHCFVLPSYHEGMANTLLEAGAMGRPLITSNIHGCLEAVRDRETGYLCEKQDADDLYEKMKLFANLPYNAKQAMAEKSRAHIASVFDKRKVVEETVKEIMQ